MFDGHQIKLNVQLELFHHHQDRTKNLKSIQIKYVQNFDANQTVPNGYQTEFDMILIPIRHPFHPSPPTLLKKYALFFLFGLYISCKIF